MAVPAVDHGADLFAYQADPFRVARIQVKGTTDGLTVFRQYSLTPMIVSYVLDPLGSADVILLTGEEAWNLPVEYVACGGKASDHHPDNGNYRWRERTGLLSSMLVVGHALKAGPEVAFTSKPLRMRWWIPIVTPAARLVGRSDPME